MLGPSYLLKTSADARIESLVSKVDYVENQSHNFILKNMAEKDVLRAHRFRSLDCNFCFYTDFSHRWWLLKVKKNK